MANYISQYTGLQIDEKLGKAGTALQPDGIKTINGNSLIGEGDLLISSNADNLLINSNFSVNQRGVSGTIIRAADAYGHDMWKGGSSGCTYSVSGSGLSAVVTVTVGTLQQVVEGLRLSDGTVCLSWVGTAQARINGGAWGASGITATATEGTNLIVEFGAGTFSCPKLERGSVATLFVQRDFSFEQTACMRYYYRMSGHNSIYGYGFSLNATTARSVFTFPVTMRVAPIALEQSGTPADYSTGFAGVARVCNGVPFFVSATNSVAQTSFPVASGLTAAQAGVCYGATANSFLGWSAEL